MNIKFHHVFFPVKSLTRSLEFYCQNFQFELIEEYSWIKGEHIIDRITGTQSTSGKVAFITAGNAFLELAEYSDQSQINNAETLTNNQGFHLCFSVDNIEEFFSMNKHLDFLTAPFDTEYGTKLCYLKDPDGILIEILEILDPDDRLNIPT